MRLKVTHVNKRHQFMAFFKRHYMLTFLLIFITAAAFCAVIYFKDSDTITLRAEDGSHSVYTYHTKKLYLDSKKLRLYTGKDLVYYSSDPSVLHVNRYQDALYMTGKKEGWATITCKLANKLSNTASIEIHVMKDELKITSIEPLKVGAHEKLSFSSRSGYQYDYNELEFNSSNSKIASVNNKGVITGINVGQTDITITSKDGCFDDKKVYVNVTAKKVKVKNGQILTKPKAKCVSTLTVQTQDSDEIWDHPYYYVVLSDSKTSKTVMSFIIKGNRTTRIKVPVGKYKISYAVGDAWYGQKLMFGYETQFFKLNSTYSFKKKGSSYSSYKIELKGSEEDDSDDYDSKRKKKRRIIDDSSEDGYDYDWDYEGYNDYGEDDVDYDDEYYDYDENDY